MITKPFKVFIGKDTARNANITGNEILSLLMTTTDADALGDGEIVVLDKAFNVLTPGATIADTDRIYIAIGTTKTFTLSPESGTAITARKIKLSDPIISGYVRNFSGKAYAAKAEQEWDVTLTAPTAGRQYVLRASIKTSMNILVCLNRSGVIQLLPQMLLLLILLVQLLQLLLMQILILGSLPHILLVLIILN